MGLNICKILYNKLGIIIIENLVKLSIYPEINPGCWLVGQTPQYLIFRITTRKDDRFMQLSSSELGQGLVEYALLLVLVVIVVIVILQLFGISVLDMYEYTVSELVDVFS